MISKTTATMTMSEQDREDAAVAAADALQPGAQVLAQGLGHDLRGQVGGGAVRGRGQIHQRARRGGRGGHDRVVVLGLGPWLRHSPGRGAGNAHRGHMRLHLRVRRWSCTRSRSGGRSRDAGPSATIRPRWRMAIRSATWKTSLRLCEITITARPRSRRRRTRSSTIPVWTTPSAAVGSSRSTTLEFHITALATATDWR